jgi:5'-phosphate synthase pdxT subunit
VIGILALQGDVAEHEVMLHREGAEALAVKRTEQLTEVDGLIIPGGESTTIGKLLRRFDLLEPLRERVRAGFPVYGTCAGMILLADEIEDAGVDQPAIGGMHIAVRRNAFGRQRESFETDLAVPALGDKPLHAVFIRAPLVERVREEVDVLATLAGGRVVAARQGNLLVSSFHPELTDDTRMHRYFIDMVEAAPRQRSQPAGAAAR